MKNFNKRESGGGRPFGGRSGGGFGGKKFGGGGGFGGGRGGGRSEMHEATCSDCGKHCEVPFRPAHGKPVYCTNCFKRNDDGGGRDSGRGFGGDREERGFGGRDRDSGRDRFSEKQMHDATCAECGNRCEVPFKPTGEKPVYCRDCFGGGKNDFSAPKKSFSPSTSAGAGASSQQLDQLNAKLDRILKTLEIIQGKKEFVVEKPKAVAEAPKKVEEKKVVEKKVVEKKVVAKASTKAKADVPSAKKVAPAKAKKK